ncbi:VOC family protein [Luteimicrobium sp. DT211]|uniref:VOC family protein n=1 Tax=Luteimicrobium sp. DT211 TaxID=3393412 RepID=UPI003CF121A8
MTQPRSVVYTVTDVAASKAVFTALFGEPDVDQPYYVGYGDGGQHVGITPSRDGVTGPIPYWPVDDAAATVAALTAAGATVVQEPQDVGGMLVAVVHDPDGGAIGISQAL